MKKVLIIIPCYNEENNISKLLIEISQLSVEGFEFTTLPVDDCSKDDTLLNIISNSVNYLNLTNNLGIGGAVQAGIKYAFRNKFDYAIQMDGDGQHPPSEVGKLLSEAVKSNCDIGLGSRYIKWEGFQSSAIRRVGTRFLNVLIWLTTKQKVFDSTSGFRLFNKKALKLFSDYYPDKYPEPEVIVYAKLNNLSIKEVPVIMKEREEGESSIKGITNSIYYMVKVSLAIFFLKLNYLFLKAR